MKNIKYLSILFNLLLTFFVIYMLSKQIPTVVDHFQMQEQSIPIFSLPLLDGTTVSSENWNSRKILVFWATWCAPCEIELARLNNMIKDGKIKDTSTIVAISSFEELALLKATAKERNYLFKIGVDLSGSVAEKFKIAGTPTIIFVNKNAKINWITTGLSPSLELRASNFLN